MKDGSVLRNWERVLIFSLPVICLLQIIFLPYTQLGAGLGYDGVWYFKPSVNLFSKIDNYHLFRIFPSALVFFARKALNLNDSIETTVRLFQWLNFALLLGSIWFFIKIRRLLQFNQAQSLVFFVFVFLNFTFLKESVYNPIMTESTSIFISLGIIYFYYNKQNGLLALFLFLALFTLPIISLFFFLYRILEKAPDQVENHEVKQIFDRFYFLVPLLVSLLFGSISAAIVYYLGYTTIYTFPDAIHVPSFPLVILINATFIYLMIKRLRTFFERLFLQIRHIKVFLFQKWTLYFLLFFVVQSVVGRINDYHLLGYGSLMVGYPIYINLKPLIGLVDNLSFYGPVIFVFLIYFFKTKNLDFKLSDWFLQFIVLFIIIKPEARATLFLLPFIAIFLIQEIDFSNWSTRHLVFLSILGLFFSKCWFPVHWAQFPAGHLLFSPETDQTIYQQFPAQFYFLFQGIMVSYSNYFITLGLEILAGIIIFKMMQSQTKTMV